MQGTIAVKQKRNALSLIIRREIRDWNTQQWNTLLQTKVSNLHWLITTPHATVSTPLHNEDEVHNDEQAQASPVAGLLAA